MIIAHEDMNIYAHVSIIEALLKFGVIFVLRFITWDKLRLYGICLCISTIINCAIYLKICQIKYKECKLIFYWNKKLFKEIAGYTGWNFFGATSVIFKYQVVNILLNQFFNPAVVAARGIATQVSGAVITFSQNFTTALRPPLIKSYASAQEDETLRLIVFGAKCSYFLLYVVLLPVLIETPMVLSLWLKKQPELTSLFVRLALIEVLLGPFMDMPSLVAQATGKIKLIQITSGIWIFNLPASWIILKIGMPAYSVSIIAIIIIVIIFIARIYILNKLIAHSSLQFLFKAVFPMLIMSIISAVIPLIVYNIMKESFLRLLVVAIISIISISCCTYIFGLTKTERQIIKKNIREKLIYYNIFSSGLGNK
jgi:O-antigen/teichoic acid export membrane protein